MLYIVRKGAERPVEYENNNEYDCIVEIDAYLFFTDDKSGYGYVVARKEINVDTLPDFIFETPYSIDIEYQLKFEFIIESVFAQYPDAYCKMTLMFKNKNDFLKWKIKNQ